MDSLELDDVKLQALEELRSRLSELLKPHHDERFLLRWLKAREYKVNEAEKMLREDFRMRKKVGSDTILETRPISPNLEPYNCEKLLGFDNEGNAVHLFASTFDFKGFSRAISLSDAVKFMVYKFEEDLKLMGENNLKTGKDACKIVHLVDLSEFRAMMWFDKCVLRYALYLLNYYQCHYPEIMKITYVVNVTPMFWYFFNIFKPFFNDVILNKIKIFESSDESWKEELLSFIPKEIIPAYLGGERYEPDAKCSAFIAWNKKVPSSLYLKDMNTLKTTDPFVKEKIIRERSVFEIEEEVKNTNISICWEFQTKCHNIRFGLYYKESNRCAKDSSDSGERKQLIPLQSVDCNVLSEKGEYRCEEPGIYILHFDNTFSWFRSKHLLYKIEVHNSSSLISIDT